LRGSTETTTDYTRRPLPVACFNALSSRWLRSGRLPRLDEGRLLETARRRAGLSDFGDAGFRAPLRMLLASLEEEARLTPLGRLIQRGRMVDLLVNRLRAEALLEARPEIREIDLGPVVVIAGLQRTGTTLLHRLLAADPRMRSLAAWEALSPLPWPGERPGRADARVRRARRAERGLAYLAPQFFAIHPAEHDAPEEDVLLLDVSFMSQAPEATFHVPRYAAWLERQDHGPAYRYMRKLMQILLWQRPGCSWVLKSPHHMEHVDELLQALPRARIVQTHRDPQKTLPSFWSMVAHARGVFSDVVDAEEVARHWLRKTRRVLDRMGASRERWGADRFLDVSYDDLLDDPLGEVKRIYDFAGLELTGECRVEMERALRRNVQHRYGRHRYRVQDFGLTPREIEDALGAYRERFAIRFEAAPAPR
jgi:hypothetical protein